MTPEGRNFGLEGAEPVNKRQQVLLRCEDAGKPECPGIVVDDVPGLVIECLREMCLHPLRNTSPYRGVHDAAGNVDPGFRIATEQGGIQ